VAEAAQVLERALVQVESMLGKLEGGAERPARAEERREIVPEELTELTQALRQVAQRLEGTLDHLGIEGQRLSNEASRLSLIADRLEARLDGLTRALREGGPPLTAEPARAPEPIVEGGPPPTAEPARAPEPTVPQEPRFRPADHAVAVVIAAVPGFQGLMDAQRGLSGLPAVEGASVHRYQNGEASLEIALRSSVTAGEIVEGLREATGHQLVIEEARPEALRLRLRFTGQESRGFGASPRLERSARPAEPSGPQPNG
jgi:hypothetical protein